MQAMELTIHLQVPPSFCSHHLLCWPLHSILPLCQSTIEALA